MLGPVMSPQELKAVSQLLVAKALHERQRVAMRPSHEAEFTVVRPFCDGRRPPGLASTPANEPGLGGYLARMAYYEEASVDAFHALAEELRAHAFPEVLARAAERAAADELKHAQWMRALAQKHGVEARRPLVKQTAVRSLEELAWDNALEGCGREAFGALIGWFQAAAAEDEPFRTIIARIAEDETRHAALSYAIHTVARFRVSPQVRRRIDRARAQAMTELASTVADDAPEAMAAAFGLPTGATARSLAQDFAHLAIRHAA